MIYRVKKRNKEKKKKRRIKKKQRRITIGRRKGRSPSKRKRKSNKICIDAGIKNL